MNVAAHPLINPACAHLFSWSASSALDPVNIVLPQCDPYPSLKTPAVDEPRLYLGKQPVSPEFRQKIADLFPKLANNKAYWRFTGYLMFIGGIKASEVIIPANLIAAIEDTTYDSNYCASDFLKAFQKDIVRLDIVPHVPYEKCRRVKCVHWSEEVHALIIEEKRRCGGDRVDFATGVKWTPKHATQDRKNIQRQALDTMANMHHHPAYTLLSLLNSEAPNRFTAIKKYLQEAHALVDGLDFSHLYADDDWDDEREAHDADANRERERQHTILKSIEAQAQPFYEAGNRTARVFAINDSLCRLQRDVRHMMTRDWLTADLRCAQLAILAKLWEVEPVSDFLRSHRSIWVELLEWMGYEPRLKPILKNAIYALVFGAGVDRMMRVFRLTGGRDAYKRFISHPLISALLRARTRQLQKIKTDGGGRDAFGKWIPLESIPISGKMHNYDNTRKIMALIAQSYELSLLTPAIELAMKYRKSKCGFVITLWIHDGFAFDCRFQDREEWKKRLIDTVALRAQKLGILTELEI